MSRWTRPVAACLLFAACAVPAVACAGVGVGTDTGKITVPKPLSTGRTYDLPGFRITDPGDKPSGYVMDVVGVSGSKVSPKGWFTFEPAAFYLYPGQAKIVHVSVALPFDASPDTYRTILVARPSVPKTKGSSNAHVNVGAGPTLVMTVVAGSWFQSALLVVTDNLLWVGLGVAAIASVLLASVLIVRRRWSRRRVRRADQVL